MIKNYLLITLRNFKRQPAYFLLNILGLTIGIAATLLILLYIQQELRFDRYHSKADRIYRVNSDIAEPDNAFKWAVTQIPLAPQLKADYPEVEEYVRFIPEDRIRFSLEDRFFFVEKVFVVDSTVCEVFDFEFIRGEGRTALKEPNSLVLAESEARRIFGESDPIGQQLKTQSDRAYKVTGVYKDMPKHSHLIANAMISSNSIEGIRDASAGSWGSFEIYSYVLLREGADAATFAGYLPDVITKYVAVIFDQFDIKIKYQLMPLTDIHLKSDYQAEPEAVGEMGFLYIFGIVALFMLLIACINYMNLATARGGKRSLEVGIRKVLGAERRQLVGQFLSESVIFTLIALLLSFTLVHFLVPTFNSIFEVSLSRTLLWSPSILLAGFTIILLTGILGGSYPAFYLSSFRPVTVLKGKLAKGSGNPRLRQGLVVLQFVITLFMLASTGIIFDQMQYLRTKELGFDKDQVLLFDLEGRAARNKYPVIRTALLRNADITAVGTATSSPGDYFSKQLMNVETANGSMDERGVDNYGVDFDFFNTMGMTITQGRNISADYSSDSSQAVLVNEAMVDRMGWSDPIGRKIEPDPGDSSRVAYVVGVIKNFHQRSLYEPIEPLLFRPRFNNSRVHVRIKNDLAGTIAFVEQEWAKIFPNRPFEYDFVDSAFMELYREDQIRSRIFTLFSLLMIIIACLGLLGLASYTAEQRTKEIGVRKVLGANSGNIIYLLTRNFVWLVALAAIPAFIATWYFMRQWLDTFTYHTRMNYWLFGLALLMTILVTLLTTGYHAIRAAYSDPVKALKYE
ncbi:MAG: ABC transporter permease [Bacteroidota bacterium]